jgi:predicted phosphatase
MIQENIEKFVFDLDRTIWDTYDARGNPIWAKQMIAPYKTVDENKIVDDVGSYCILRQGFREYMNFLYANNKKISFLSVGALYGTRYESQPSVRLLKLFSIYEKFNDTKLLLYKVQEKKKHLQNLAPCVFFDDSPKHLQAVANIENIFEHNSENIKNWSQFL